jgi:medium-chain acyl-[acyl-carrier-protein] hydrolase
VLFLPYAGGSAASFQSWSGRLPADHVFVGVELPGRGRRFREPFAATRQEVVDGIGAELAAFGDHRLVLFGHSLGAALAYELALALERTACPPSLAIISAGRPPWAGLNRPALAHLPLPEFLAAAVRYGLGSPELASDPELAATYGPVLRADVGLSEQRALTTDTPTSVPMALLGGKQDRLVPEGALRHWSGLAQEPPSVHLFDGGHMFIHEHGDLVLAALTDLLIRSRDEDACALERKSTACGLPHPRPEGNDHGAKEVPHEHSRRHSDR